MCCDLSLGAPGGLRQGCWTRNAFSWKKVLVSSRSSSLETVPATRKHTFNQHSLILSKLALMYRTKEVGLSRTPQWSQGKRRIIAQDRHAWLSNLSRTPDSPFPRNHESVRHLSIWFKNPEEASREVYHDWGSTTFCHLQPQGFVAVGNPVERFLNLREIRLEDQKAEFMVVKLQKGVGAHICQQRECLPQRILNLCGEHQNSKLLLQNLLKRHSFRKTSLGIVGRDDATFRHFKSVSRRVQL